MQVERQRTFAGFRMAEVDQIHIVCRDREGVVQEMPNRFESAAWAIARRHLRPGVLFALHQTKTAASYLQGHVAGFRPATDGRLIVDVERSAEALEWRGAGSGEIGFLWSGADWSHLPQIPIAIRNLRPGENHALKNLNEADPASFQYPRAGEFRARTGGRPDGGRQSIFNTYLLRIALALERRTVPYAFGDAAGQPYRLDDGTIGHAIRQGVLDEPGGDLDGHVRSVCIDEAHWRRQEASGLVDLLRVQNRDLDGVGGDLFEEFDPAAVSVEAIRQAVITIRAMRAGQAAFRQRLIEAYGGQCPVTRCAFDGALDAAHIIPDSVVGERGMDPRNGLLLRADLHRLFDCGLIGFRMDGDDLRMVTALVLEGSEYEQFASQPVRVPAEPVLRPSRRCIERRWAALPVR